MPMGYFKEKVLHQGAFLSGLAWDSGMFLTSWQCPHMAPLGYPGSGLTGPEGTGELGHSSVTEGRGSQAPA